jgi:hypothetical protein
MVLAKQNMGWEWHGSVSATSVSVTNATAVDLRSMTHATVYASSTAGTPTLTVWTAASSTGTYRLLKSSTGGAVSVVVVANAAIRLPANVAGAGMLKLQTSGATISSLQLLLKQ